MNTGRWYIVCLLAALLGMAGCEGNAPSQRVLMPVEICLPANEVQSAQYMPSRRALGDPGETEQFLFPHHLYIVVIKQNGDETWSVWRKVHRTLTDGEWVPKRYVGLLPTIGDSIYQYTEEIDLLLSSADKFKGRVYAVASAEELSMSPAFDAIDSGTDLDDLLDLTFSVADPKVQENLKHIYSTPYNLEYEGKYFGEFNSTHQRVPHLSLLLYHVAAKVDIKWKVDEEVRVSGASPVRLTYMKAQHLFNGNAYCFRPLENQTAAPITTGYSSDDIVTAADEGLWWEGRSYFYTIPYTTTESGKEDYFPLQMVMQTNESGADYTPTLYLEIEKSSPFVPWLRANFNLSTPLADKSETIMVEN